MEAIIYCVDGSHYEIKPADGYLTLKLMQNIVGGYIDIQELPEDGKLMVLNDCGKLDGLDKNEKATEIWKRNYPITEYPINNDELVVGNVIVCDSSMVR